MKQGLELNIEGMTCASCVKHVENALTAIPGVSEVSVNLATNRAHLKKEQAVAVSTLLEAVSEAGYTASEEITGEQQLTKKKTSPWHEAISVS